MKKSVLIIATLLLSSTLIMSQYKKENRIPLIGSDAPAFKANSTNGELNFPTDFGKTGKFFFPIQRILRQCVLQNFLNWLISKTSMPSWILRSP